MDKEKWGKAHDRKSQDGGKVLFYVAAKGSITH